MSLCSMSSFPTLLLLSLLASLCASEGREKELVQPLELVRFKEVLAILQSFPNACKPPYQDFHSFCLLYSPNRMTWMEADSFCRSKNGYLAWIENKEEHIIIQLFARKKRGGYFWIGLSKESNSSFTWTAGSRSFYRGSKLVYRNERYFAANTRDLKIVGGGPRTTSRVVCRRFQSLTSRIQELTRATAIIQSQVMELTSKVQCPSPWKRLHHMCLLSIFTLRTHREAEDFCFQMGGGLVWFADRQEHMVINNFHLTLHYRSPSHFWTGLYKDSEEKLRWSGGMSRSAYSGTAPLMSNPKHKYFFSRSSFLLSGTTTLHEAEGTEQFSIVCRRAL